MSGTQRVNKTNGCFSTHVFYHCLMESRVLNNISHTQNILINNKVDAKNERNRKSNYSDLFPRKLLKRFWTGINKKEDIRLLNVLL